MTKSKVLPITLMSILLGVILINIFKNFIIHNDWLLLLDPIQFRNHPEYGHLFYIGRPIGAILLNLQFQLSDGLNAIKLYRVLAFSSLIFILTILYRNIVSLCRN